MHEVEQQAQETAESVTLLPVKADLAVESACNTYVDNSISRFCTGLLLGIC